MTEPWQIHVCPVHGPRTPTMLGDCPVGCCAEVMEVVRVVRDTREDRMDVIAREGVIDDAMHEIAMRVQDGDGEPMDPAWRREFAEAVAGRLADELVGAVGHARVLQARLDAIVKVCDQFEGRAEKSVPGLIRSLATVGGQSSAEEAFEQSSGGETLEEAQARQLRGEHAFSPQPETRGAVDEILNNEEGDRG
jgi:hypothetical protein